MGRAAVMKPEKKADRSVSPSYTGVLVAGYFELLMKRCGIEPNEAMKEELHEIKNGFREIARRTDATAKRMRSRVAA